MSAFITVRSMGRADRSFSIEAFLRDRVAGGDFPGAVAVVRERGSAVVAVATGDAVVVPERIAATAETIFDLASLTKPLATALLFLLALERDYVALDQAVASVLPEFDREDKRAITFRQLLTHTSGLPRWVPLYAVAEAPSRAIGAIADLPLAYPAGSRVVYSDPNYIALGFALERIGNATLDALFESEIAGPLDLNSMGYRPDGSFLPRIAASETGNEYERALAGEEAQGYDGWRTGTIWGTVHDGNAHFLRGVAGHAGLFGTAGEAARVAEQFLPGSRLLVRDESFALVRTNLTPGLEEHRSVGWMLASSPDCSAGPAMPDDAFGHTGFTGTSIWVDPHAMRVVALMTNRTHPVYGSPPMTEIRRAVNTLAAG
ncbi:MAG: serine hydrolase domain-containing protein [Blastocatellia bacterium]